jgi:hypothetical protein
MVVGAVAVVKVKGVRTCKRGDRGLVKVVLAAGVNAGYDMVILSDSSILANGKDDIEQQHEGIL